MAKSPLLPAEGGHGPRAGPRAAGGATGRGRGHGPRATGTPRVHKYAEVCGDVEGDVERNAHFSY